MTIITIDNKIKLLNEKFQVSKTTSEMLKIQLKIKALAKIKRAIRKKEWSL